MAATGLGDPVHCGNGRDSLYAPCTTEKSQSHRGFLPKSYGHGGFSSRSHSHKQILGGHKL